MLSAPQSLLRESALAAAAPIVTEESDPLSSWFHAAEQLGEFVGIRFGRFTSAKSEPEWGFLSHADYDGIGGLAHILRTRGADLPRLPQIKHPSLPSPYLLLRTWANYIAPRQRLRWNHLHGETGSSSNSTPPPAVAWHAFDEASTTQIRRVCRKQSITVNSFLIKNLTKAIRGFLLDQSLDVPWMVPVNLRGKVNRTRDTANHSSYVGVKIRSYETAHDVHRSIYAALGRAEHWANWYAYQSSRLLSSRMQQFLIEKELCTSQWSIGGFSNLGDWDSEKQITQPACAGPWFFCPPVLRLQVIGAGAVTFQNRLSLTIQAHQELTTSSKTLWVWIQQWVKEIELDLASILSEHSSTVGFNVRADQS